VNATTETPTVDTDQEEAARLELVGRVRAGDRGESDHRVSDEPPAAPLGAAGGSHLSAPVPRSAAPRRRDGPQPAAVFGDPLRSGRAFRYAERGGPTLVDVQLGRPRRWPVSVRRRPLAVRAGGRPIGYPLSVREGSSPNSRR
jgi:hypothetical protein